MDLVRERFCVRCLGNKHCFEAGEEKRIFSVRTLKCSGRIGKRFCCWVFRARVRIDFPPGKNTFPASFRNESQLFIGLWSSTGIWAFGDVHPFPPPSKKSTNLGLVRLSWFDLLILEELKFERRQREIPLQD